MRDKVSVIGAGNVGATLAQRLAELDLVNVALVDVVEGLAEGKALDLLEAGPVVGYDSTVVGSSDYAITSGSRIVVITSGLARKPGMSRDDLVSANAKIVGEVTAAVVERSPDAILIIVTNPLDVMTELALRVSRLPRTRVIGMAGVLDTARFRTFLAAELGVSVRSVEAYVLGGHGDSMVPLRGVTTVAGVPVGRLLPPERLEEVVQRTRDGGAEIVRHLKTGSAFYAPSAAAAQMVEAILLDRAQILPCAIRLEGEYGLNGVVMGVPVKLGMSGVEQVIEVELTPAERAELVRSAAAVRETVAVLG
ncbi:MAG TPA: malate dehydrogenase [Candidatus Dormibacteraeota bacterium]|nr:malate dehydrogenase [Candidatus Dormibacteraeota bacterium]